MSVSPKTLELTVGDTRQFSATVLPSDAANKTVAWSVEPADVASVSSGGLVTALKAGSATITATTADGAKTATAALTVAAEEDEPAPAPIEDSYFTTDEAVYVAEDLPAATTDATLEKVSIANVGEGQTTQSITVNSVVALEKIYVAVDGAEGYLELDAVEATRTTRADGYSYTFTIEINSEGNFTIVVSALTQSGEVVATISVDVKVDAPYEPEPEPEPVDPPTEGTMGTLTWKFEDGTLTIGGEGEIMRVPNGRPEWHDAYHSSITKIVIGDGVTAIGPWMFMQYTSLTSVSFGSGLTSIGGNVEGAWDQIGAFQYCSGLTSIVIPGNVTTIMGNAFQDCSSLASVTISEGVQTIGQSAFLKTAISSIDIPDSVTTIGAFAFAECPNLTSVTIGSGLTSISAPFTLTPIQSVRIEATTPPTLVGGDNPYPGSTLYVPAGTLEAYQNSNFARLFETVVEQE